MCEVVLLAANVVGSFLTQWSGNLSWIAAPTAAVLAATGKLLVEEFGAAPPDGEPGRQGPVDSGPPRTSLALVLVIAVVGIGGTGYAVTAGVRYATGYVTGNESGVERLAAPVATEANGMILSVDSVEHTSHFTRVSAVVTNRTSNAVSLPVFHNASLVDQDGTTLEADAFRSDFTERVAPGGTRRGTLVFVGHVTDAATTVELSFATVFQQGFDGPRSLTLRSIGLRPYAG